MSIYATLWRLKFPRDGDDYLGCEWSTVTAQGVPPHIGSPTPGCGYEDEDPYAAFLPPAVHTDADGEHEYMRAVVFVTENTPKGTYGFCLRMARLEKLTCKWVVLRAY